MDNRIEFLESHINSLQEEIDFLVDALQKILQINPTSGCSRADLSLAFGEAQKIAEHAFRTQALGESESHEAETNYFQEI